MFFISMSDNQRHSNRNGGQNVFIGRKGIGELRKCIFNNVCTYLSTIYTLTYNQACLKVYLKC